MSVKDFQFCLFKYKKLLAVLTAVAILACSLFICVNQSYTAECYIKYLGDNALSGSAANGDVLNPYEIADSLVVSRTLKQLGFDDMSVDEIRKSIKITPVISVSEEEKYASWIDRFSDYELTEENKEAPIYYSVKYTTDKGEDFARTVLGALLGQYRAYYAEKYIGLSDVILLSDADAMRYDYFETAKLIEDKIESDISYLQGISASGEDYRSPSTGYSVTDLVNEYRFILQNDLASISQGIIERGVSKDTAVLTANMLAKADNSLLLSEENAAKAATEKEMLALYSEKNKDYLWDSAKDSYLHESSQVREDTERDKNYFRTASTYDGMMLDYVDYATSSADQLIDKAYYEEYASYFHEDNASDATLETQLLAICEKYNEVHKVTEATVADYNNYKASRSLSQVSGIASYESMGTMIYYAAAVIFALGVGITYAVACELVGKKKI